MTIALMLGLLAATSFAPPEFRAELLVPDGDTKAPIGLEFAPSIAQHEREPLEEAFAKALPLACENLPCTDSDCSDDESVVGLALGGERRDYSLHWVATDPRLDAPLIVDSRCELCSLVELEDQFAVELSRLCSRLDTLDTGPSVLALSSDPLGARVRIDGVVVGRTPWSGELPAGKHTVQLQAWGHRPQREIVAISGPVNKHIHLQDNLRFSEGRPTWPGWASLSLGIAMTVAGTALISVHGQPWSSRCSGANIDVLGNCRYVLKTRPLGIGLVTAGAGAIGGGVGLLVWAQRGRSQRSAGINIRGRF